MVWIEEKEQNLTLAVSVIVSVYNMGKYVRECLDSVLSQTLQNIEVLCVDDGSTDDSLSILEEYAKRDARVKVITQENKGLAATKNGVMKFALGEYIAFMDPDDWYPSDDVLECLFNAAKKHDVDIVGGSLLLYRNGAITDSFDGVNDGDTFHIEGIVDYFNYQFDYSFQRFLYKRSFLMGNDINFPLYKRYSDPPFFVKAMLKAKKFYAIPKIVYAYRKGHQEVEWTQEKLLDVISGLRDIFVASKSENLDILYWRNYMRLIGIMPIIRGFQNMSFEIIDKLFDLDRVIDMSLIEEKIPDVEEKPLLQTLIADCMDAWWSALAPEDKAPGFDKMLSDGGGVAKLSRGSLRNISTEKLSW